METLKLSPSPSAAPKVSLRYGDADKEGETPDINLTDSLDKSPQGVEIVPEPGFVIKSTQDGQKKVFINVCSSGLVSPPTLIKRLDDAGNEVEGLRFPISVGEPREELDKSGKECVVYDAVFNTKEVSSAIDDKSGRKRDELCEIALGHVQKKYDCEIDARYKLPKTKYMGKISSQWIRDTSKEPRIEEVTPSQAPVKAEESKEKETLLPAPAYKLIAKWYQMEEPVDRDVTNLSLDVSVTLPVEELPSQIQLRVFNISEGALHKIEVADISINAFEACLNFAGHERLRVTFPYLVEPSQASCLADPHTRSITVEVPLNTHSGTNFADPGSLPWMLSQALEGASSTGSDRPQREQKARETVASHSPSMPESDGDEEYPEDKFHKKDIISQHMIGLHEQERNKKQARAREERAAAKEEGIEYIDVDKLRGAADPLEAFEQIPSSPLDLDASTALEASSVIKPSMKSSRWSEIL